MCCGRSGKGRVESAARPQCHASTQLQEPPPLSPLPTLDVSPELCFDVSSDSQLSSILSSQNRHLSIHMHQGTFFPLPLGRPPLSLSAVSSSLLSVALHWPTSIAHEDVSGHEPPCYERCHMWLPLFIKLTQARLRSCPLPALGPAHYSQYLHAILNCWEFPWWWEPPLHEIFRPRWDSREAQRRVFTPIWLYDMIFSWAMTVLLN